MKDYQRIWRTRRDVFIEKLKPLLTQGWFETSECCAWLKANSGRQSIPTTKELGTCLPKHPNIRKRKRKNNEWTWVE